MCVWTVGMTLVTKMKVNLIVETRWWAKEVAQHFFWTFNTNYFNAILFKNLIQVMKTTKYLIQDDSESRAKIWDTVDWWSFLGNASANSYFPTEF